MILVDFLKIAHWESAGGKVNFQVIADLNWRDQGVFVAINIITSTFPL